MKKIVILGGGTAGTMMLNKLSHTLDRDQWSLTIIDRDKNHYYQPGFLFVPFGIYTSKDIVRKKIDFYPLGTNAIFDTVTKIDPKNNLIQLEAGQPVSYDILIVATGCTIEPDETEGLKGPLWQKSIFDFYTPDGAAKLADFLTDWEGGKMILNLTEMPIKCPVAPLEFLFLADEFFTNKGIRDKVEITYATPLPGAFTKPRASAILGDFLKKKGIKLVTEFDIGQVDNENKKIVSHGGKELPFDLLVTIPTNMGSSVVEDSEMGDELRFIPTDNETLQSKDHQNIFVIGDATTLPASKAGSVAHFEADILIENILSYIAGKELKAKFDGHANCFIESGFGKGMLIDFNYTTEPLPGKFPLPGVGPFTLLGESAMNHYGKMMFRWVYWNLLLRGEDLPIGPEMLMAGKRR
ncbi:MAG: NAD(P)/FAD-dependent oxidoreductase [Bdellovibrionales bacterium]|jgi:sulfide:quinone oxidoreductase|nr:NAD(P)/FAD-dependent oxidoreductase [Bdellovibrionales bacterium]MBT3525473.1 NAD(P)/FAD-dependent oxidoreductase [Bdellovibrionales bacterium]MBT7669959.1 NAD(P)/FAD-dependent oxidoreductase [Bdellovibrionales bacterium]MBT7768094.1 NAD(P)/FAD-dependent oxidoreductase [Bdellovibrionales bacterium]